MLKGFKDFLMRGNVIDLAVAVVVGTAFTAIVTSFTTNIINPLIARIGGSDAVGLGFRLGDSDATFLNIGAVITAFINFVIVAAVVYFLIVLPFNALKSLRAKKVEETTEPLTDNQLLVEIRDLLAAQQKSEQQGQHRAE